MNDMTKYYLIINSKYPTDIGDILSVEENETVENELEHKLLSKNDITELSALEYKYYEKMNRSERIKRHINGTFKDISELNSGDKCKFRTNNEYLTVQILKKINQLDDIYFKCKQENGDDCDIPASSIDEIIQFDQGDGQSRSGSTETNKLRNDGDAEAVIKNGFYILSNKVRNHSAGLIIQAQNGTVKSLDNSYIFMNHDLIKDHLINLEKDEAIFLHKFPIYKRMKKYKEEYFRRLIELQIGQECYLRTAKYRLAFIIIDKYSESDLMKFDLKEKRNSRNIRHEVDISDIVLPKQIWSPFIDPVLSFNMQINRKSNSSNDSLSTTKYNSKLIRIENIDVNIIDPFLVNSIENILKPDIRKIMYLNRKRGKQIINIKWRGIINGDLCVGCELANSSEYGTDGTFADQKLFNCGYRKGILIPVDILNEGCESRMHKKIVKFDRIFNRFLRDFKSIDIEYICCVEWLTTINKWPQLQITSRIKYKNKDIFGTCKWIGLVNGKEAVGVEMDNECKGTNGRFSSFDLFTCMDGRGLLFTADDIVHDKDSEKPHFISDKIIDTNKLSIVEPFENNNETRNISGNIAMIEINNKKHIGEVKWMGMINNEKCVGLDMEDQFEYGMDGIIKNDIIFDCKKGHGLITPLANVTFCEDELVYSNFIINGLINPNKYLKCKENWNREFFNERNLKTDNFVFVILRNESTETKMKGTLRWCGLMNDIPVGIVELTRDHEYGTNGMFWRSQLLQCPDKRAIAVTWNNIYQYFPYEPKEIPKEDRIFSDIDINSVVKYNLVMNYERDLSGTVKWTGVDEDGKYFYGLEMDGKIPDGTDGQFNGQRLFQCQPGHGKLAPINNIAKGLGQTEEERKLELFDKYFLDLFKCSNNSDLEIRIFKDILESKNERVIKSIIECKDHPLKLDVHEYLIPLLIEKENIQLIKLILKNCDVSTVYSQTFLNLANLALKIEDQNLFKCAIEKCQDKNALLENGETFLTNLLKRNNSIELINGIISQNIFDVHILNKNGESGLTLACEKQIPSIMEITTQRQLLPIRRQTDLKLPLYSTRIPDD